MSPKSKMLLGRIKKRHEQIKNLKKMLKTAKKQEQASIKLAKNSSQN